VLSRFVDAHRFAEVDVLGDEVPHFELEVYLFRGAVDWFLAGPFASIPHYTFRASDRCRRGDDAGDAAIVYGGRVVEVLLCASRHRAALYSQPFVSWQTKLREDRTYILTVFKRAEEIRVPPNLHG
jgi:hypothetical protein